MSAARLILSSRGTPSPTLRELAATLFRQSRLVAASFLLVFMAAVVWGFISPRYEAHFKVLLRRGRSDPLVSPAPTVPDLTRAEITEEDLNSEVELLRDEDLLKRVVEVSGRVVDGKSSSRQEAVERAVRDLSSHLNVQPMKKSNFILVSYRCKDPQAAAEVLQALADAYQKRHLALRRPSGELQFFEEQARESEQRLQNSERNLVNFTVTSGVSSAGTERDIALEKLGEAQAGYREISQERAAAEERITALSKQVSSFPLRSVTQKRWADNPQLLETMKARLLDLQLKRTELLTRFQPSYRLVQEVDQQIATTKQAITAEALTPVRDETTDKDPNYEWARMELEKAQVERDGLKARESVASAQIAALVGVARQRQADYVAQQDLIRTAKADEDNYLLYLRKREEARIGEALDAQRILNVAITEPPVAPALPVHSALFYPGIGFAIALLFSIATAFTAEYLDPTIRTPHEAEELLDVPVLAWLPAAKPVKSITAGRGVYRR